MKTQMSDNDSKKTLGLGGSGRSGQVKQSFSHGRTKSVVVETKRKRVVVPKAGHADDGCPERKEPSHGPYGRRSLEAPRRHL